MQRSRITSVAGRCGAMTCLGHALRLLARRPHSVHEIREKLECKGREPAEIEKTIERLLEGGLLDDKAYCGGYARSRADRMKFGPAKLRADLVRKGFDDGLIQETLDDIYGDGDGERGMAHRAAVKKARSLGPGLGRDAIRKKLFDHLVRRGFSAEAARAAALDGLEEIINESIAGR